MIQSNLEIAKQVATKMENASDSIQDATNKSINTADQTTLDVNRTAQDMNKNAIQLAELFHEAFQQTIQDIHSAAAEFERIDQELNQSINQLSPMIESTNDINTYLRAKNR